jgi:hypothetical protein
LPVSLAFLVSIFRLGPGDISSPFFWIAFSTGFRALLALVPLVFVAGILTFIERSHLIFAWAALFAGMFLSVILSENASSIPIQFVRLITLMLAVGFVFYAIVTLVQGMSARGRRST